MADTQIWLGTTDDDFSVTTNWGGGGGNKVPVTGDSVVVPKIAGNHMKTNLDRSQDAAGVGLNLVLFYVEEGSPVEIGSSSTPLQLTADEIIHRGAEPFYFNSATGSGAETTDKIEVNAANRIDAMSIDSSDPASAGVAADISRVTLLRGKTTISSGTTKVLPRLEIAWNTSPSSDVICVVESGGATITLVLMNGGEMVCKAVVTTAIVMAGRWTQDIEEILTLHMSGRPNVIYDTAKGGTPMTTANIMGGVLDLTRTSDEREITAVYIWPGALFLRDPSLFTGSEYEIGGGIAATQAAGVGGLPGGAR